MSSRVYVSVKTYSFLKSLYPKLIMFSSKVIHKRYFYEIEVSEKMLMQAFLRTENVIWSSLKEIQNTFNDKRFIAPFCEGHEPNGTKFYYYIEEIK